MTLWQQILTYAQRYPHKLTDAFLQHVSLVAVTLALSLVLAVVITWLIADHRRLSELAVSFLAALYSVPSLAFFALLIPLLGIGRPTALTVLVIYNQFLLVRNFLAGLSGVDAGLADAAAALGMTPTQVLLHIKLPLALPVILAGIRLALISTIGIATIAAVVDAGGIGVLLFDGLRSHKPAKIIWGTALSATLAAAASLLMTLAEKTTGKGLHHQ